MRPQPRMVEVRQRVLKQNDLLARNLRERFRRAGTYVVSIVSSPGSGKTTFLERLLATLRGQSRVAALVGDLATENDALRLQRSGAPVKQITTGSVCHLDASMVSNALEGWDVSKLDILFIENVGNLVCPSSYDLGEDLRVVLLSVTEGEDKPLKYPTGTPGHASLRGFRKDRPRHAAVDRVSAERALKSCRNHRESESSFAARSRALASARSFTGWL